MTMAPGRPKVDETVRLAAYSTNDGCLGDLGRNPLTGTSTLFFPDSVSSKLKKKKKVISHRHVL